MVPPERTQRSITRETTSRRVGHAISAAMDALGLKAPAVAAHLQLTGSDIQATQVNNWREGRTQVPLHLCQPLAEILHLTDGDSVPEVVSYFGYDPGVMIRLLGLLPDDRRYRETLGRVGAWAASATDEDVLQRLLHLQQLNDEITDRQQEWSDLSRGRGTTAVTKAVLDSGKYAVGIWPVITGPTHEPRHQLHVSDRLDIRRLDGGPLTTDLVWDDLGVVLRGAWALPSTAFPRWAASSENTAPLPISDPHVSMWNLRQLDTPRRARVGHHHTGFPAIALSANTSASWVGNVAAIVALVLGYSLTSTIDLSRLLWSKNFRPSTKDRNHMHDGLLQAPGQRRVWYHVAVVDQENPESPWSPTQGRADPELVHIRLYESDDLLRAVAEDRARHPQYPQNPAIAFNDWRRSRDMAADRMPQHDRVIQLEVRHAELASVDKWHQTFTLALRVLQALERLGLEPWPELPSTQDQLRLLEPGLAPPSFNWLRDNGAPFVA